MTDAELQERVNKIMDDAWRTQGYCVPNLDTYPHQWLWDSCFHSLIWAQLGDGRAVTELEAALSHQNPAGFVPHMTYWDDPEAASGFWGRTKTSSITQPPMYGHAAAELVARGFELSEDLLARIEAAFRHLLQDRKRTPAGLIPIYHPWESGCDDSPRWDRKGADPGDPAASFDAVAWRRTKGELVSSLQFDDVGSPVANDSFSIGSIGFNALTVFNFDEFRSIPGLAQRPGVAELHEGVERLRTSISQRWDPKLETWLDDAAGSEPCVDAAAGDAAGGSLGGRSVGSRTADSLLGLLILERPEVAAQLGDKEAFAGAFGPAGVHRQESVYDSGAYWRGPSWPQLNYLLHIAALRRGHETLASELASSQRHGAVVSGFAEYWNADTGQGLGAIPQTWAGLAIAHSSNFTK